MKKFQWYDIKISAKIGDVPVAYIVLVKTTNPNLAYLIGKNKARLAKCKNEIILDAACVRVTEEF